MNFKYDRLMKLKTSTASRNPKTKQGMSMEIN